MKLFFSLLLGVILFFVLKGPSDFSSLIYHALWNLGHPFCFALTTYYILKQYLENYTYRKQTLFILLFTMVLSLLIEFLQETFNRTFDWSDIFLNLLGSCLVLIWLTLKDKKPYSFSYNSIIVINILLLIIILFPIYQAILIQLKIHQSFPILSIFNEKIELKKWKGDNLSLTRNTIPYSSQYSLQATMLASRKYNPVTLKHFAKNWTGFKSLKINVELDSKLPIELCVRITDMQHDISDQKYDDRYQQCFKLATKNNTLIIPIGDIQSAPLTRKLDINHISEVTLFSRNLSINRIIYIHDIELL